MSADPATTISYGKARVPFYRVYARPLAGLAAIPESAFTGRPNVLLAGEVDIEVFGDNFLPAYTHGDNSQVVATDSMKNFVFERALDYDGATLEGLLDHLGRALLATYAHMQRLRLTAREWPFTAATVPGPAGAFTASETVFRREHGDHSVAALEFDRAADGSATLTAHRCGRDALQLLKVTGSAFTAFVRDNYTTLPERRDRPLYITMDLAWHYADPADALGAIPARYVAAEQVRDLAQVVFHEFVSESIQHLVHEMGQRILARYPQLASVSFAAQNHTPDPMAVAPDGGRVKVYSAAFPAYGLITLTLAR
ncbi:MAG TPA: urate oxidase [Ktedonobacterales bacterium]|jgi:urate oxidase